MNSWPMGSWFTSTKRTSVCGRTRISLVLNRLRSMVIVTVTGPGPSDAGARRRTTAPRSRPTTAPGAEQEHAPRSRRARPVGAPRSRALMPLGGGRSRRHPTTSTSGAPRMSSTTHHASSSASSCTTKPARRADGSVSAWVDTARSWRRCAGGGADLHVAEPHRVGHPAHVLVAAQVVEQRRRRRLAASDGDAGVGGEHRGTLVGEEEHVGIDDLGRVEPESEDPQRHPRFVGRDGQHDRRAVAGLLAEGRGARRVEARGHEDLRTLRVEVEHLRRVGREQEAVVDRPATDRVTAAAEDRDVERVDLHLLEHFGVVGDGAGGRRRTRLGAWAVRSHARAVAGSSRPRARPWWARREVARSTPPTHPCR